jgi:general secretion pathway protein A
MLAPLSFTRELSAADLMQTPQLNEGFARLRYAINSKSLGVVTATPGTGKSSLVRRLDASLDKSRFLVCYINETDLKPKTLYARLLAALSVQPVAYLDKLKKQFRDALVNLHSTQDRLLVLIVDNAQELPAQTLKEFRYLFSFEMDSKSLLSLILIGHPEFWDTLQLRAFEPLSQFIATHYRMPGLDESQVKEYIIHHLSLSGMAMCFPDDTVKRITQFTFGIPRNINSVCRYCLIDMEAHQLSLADNQVLDRVFREIRPYHGGAE